MKGWINLYRKRKVIYIGKTPRIVAGAADRIAYCGSTVFATETEAAEVRDETRGWVATIPVEWTEPELIYTPGADH